jgi:transposase-like protein
MTVQKANHRFTTKAECIAYLEQLRWKGKVSCPYCDSPRISTILREQRHHCNSCNTTFSVTVNMFFHHTRLPLPKWFAAIPLVLDTTRQITARELALKVEINKNTAWFVITRIQDALVDSGQRRWLYAIAEAADSRLQTHKHSGERRIQEGS